MASLLSSPCFKSDIFLVYLRIWTILGPQIGSLLRPGKKVSPLLKANTMRRTHLWRSHSQKFLQLLRSELEELHAEDVALYNYVAMGFSSD